MEIPAIQPIRSHSCGPLRLVGMQNQFSPETMDQIPALWHQFGPKIDSVPNKSSDLAFGVVWDTRHENSFRYMAAVDQKSDGPVPEEMTVLEIPAQTYEVFEHVGSLQNLSDTIGAIFQSWFPSSGRSQGDFPSMLEVYGHEFDPQTSSGRIELWVSVQED